MYTLRYTLRRGRAPAAPAPSTKTGKRVSVLSFFSRPHPYDTESVAGGQARDTAAVRNSEGPVGLPFWKGAKPRVPPAEATIRSARPGHARSAS